jgi:hypothetical protein
MQAPFKAITFYRANTTILEDKVLGSHMYPADNIEPSLLVTILHYQNIRQCKISKKTQDNGHILRT